MRPINVANEVELVFHAGALNRGQAHLANRDPSTIVGFLDIFHPAAHRGDHMTRRLQDRVDHAVMDRRHVAPGRP